jgi:hypothetical protein
MFVYALQVKRQHPAVDVVTMLVVMGVIGYSFYFLYPVCGPKFAFPSFPLDPPQVTSSLIPVPPAPRNGMPSLHMASGLIAYLHARRYGRIATAVAAVFVAGTFLATMGTREHYFIDLLVALPFTIAVDALLTRRWLRGAINVTVFLGWLWLLHAPLSPVVAWAGLLVTVLVAVYGTRRSLPAALRAGNHGHTPPPRLKPGATDLWLPSAAGRMSPQARHLPPDSLWQRFVNEDQQASPAPLAQVPARRQPVHGSPTESRPGTPPASRRLPDSR